MIHQQVISPRCVIKGPSSPSNDRMPLSCSVCQAWCVWAFLSGLSPCQPQTNGALWAYQQSCQTQLVHTTAQVWNCRFRLLRTHTTFMQLQMHLVLTKSSRNTSQPVSSKTSEIAGSNTFREMRAIGIISWSDLKQHSWDVIIMTLHLCFVKILAQGPLMLESWGMISLLALELVWVLSSSVWTHPCTGLTCFAHLKDLLNLSYIHLMFIY